MGEKMANSHNLVGLETLTEPREATPPETPRADADEESEVYVQPYTPEQVNSLLESPRIGPVKSPLVQPPKYLLPPSPLREGRQPKNPRRFNEKAALKIAENTRVPEELPGVLSSPMVSSHSVSNIMSELSFDPQECNRASEQCIETTRSEFSSRSNPQSYSPSFSSREPRKLPHGSPILTPRLGRLPLHQAPPLPLPVENKPVVVASHPSDLVLKLEETPEKPKPIQSTPAINAFFQPEKKEKSDCCLMACFSWIGRKC